MPKLWNLLAFLSRLNSRVEILKLDELFSSSSNKFLAEQERPSGTLCVLEERTQLFSGRAALNQPWHEIVLGKQISIIFSGRKQFVFCSYHLMQNSVWTCV